MADNTAWYEENADSPEGGYGAIPFRPTAANNPENRKGTLLHRHSEYGSTAIQRALAEGLSIIREDSNRVVLIGGDLPNQEHKPIKNRNQPYYHVKYDSETHQYTIVHEKAYDRHTTESVRGVYDYLDERLPEQSYVVVLLIYIKNSPYNTDDQPDYVIAA